jgi:hypothetical protein
LAQLLGTEDFFFSNFFPPVTDDVQNMKRGVVEMNFEVVLPWAFKFRTSETLKTKGTRQNTNHSSLIVDKRT